MEPTALKELADSIQQLGILQPITVRYIADDQIYQIISGERRYQAALQAGLTEIPCWVQTPEERQILVRQVVENWQRAELHPFEIADSLAALRDTWGYSQTELAALIGKSKGDVSKFLSLLTLDPAIAKQCRDDTSGTLTRKHLEALARTPKSAQADVLKQVSEQHLTAKETERIVRDVVARHSGKKHQGAPVGKIFRFATLKATVTVQLRKASVDSADILEALDAARDSVLRAASEQPAQTEATAEAHS